MSGVRYESSVFSISWIPSEAIEGMTKLPFEMGVAHYDDPPPDEVHDLQALEDEGRFRFANLLTAWIEVDDGHIVDHGQGGKSFISSTKVGLRRVSVDFEPVAYSDIVPEPEVGDGWVRFTRTAGGRTGVPAPRRVRRPPFVQVSAPTAWTTLSLTLHADGSSSGAMPGASPFPRHWLYDQGGVLRAKSGMIDFDTWYKEAFGSHSPWGDWNSPALVTEVETALERQLSLRIMRGDAKPEIRELQPHDVLCKEGDPGEELFMLLDGVLRVDVGGEPLAELGPGCVLGERALLEGGNRTATLTAVTPCKVAIASGDQIDPAALTEVSKGHRREDG